jgi:hypothetical protein
LEISDAGTDVRSEYASKHAALNRSLLVHRALPINQDLG